MKYISTRGRIEPIEFDQAVMMGLARDGGLLLPETLPSVPAQKLDAWQNLQYQGLALKVLYLFSGNMPRNDLEELIERAYSSFRHPQVTPVRKVDDLYIMELFHGPTPPPNTP
ncbi:MAG: threonine synthase, partial [Candidatus Electrothrix sp. LOE1_4_5]|nr:threonine synthase [Candidatus Electrothrix gigas]